MQHLQLHIGCQRQAVAFHLHRSGQTALLLELAQRGLERGFDRLRIGAGAKVHQQFAYVGVAFAYPGVDLGQDPLCLQRVLLVEGVLHQLHLDLQERQRLCNRVVQFARQEAAFLGHGSFLFEGVEAQVFHRCRQVRGQRLKQRTFRIRNAALGVEEQVNLAHQPVVQADRDRHHGLKAGNRAVVQSVRLHAAHRDDAQAQRHRR